MRADILLDLIASQHEEILRLRAEAAALKAAAASAAADARPTPDDGARTT